ncbi:MAG TPA: CHAT domain-containing protein, partial [Candidatus Eisenbacteria bacterium]|nr:CHAT domain-containing protein [Candidatus Eisenbacteria bacterium]
MRIVGVVAFAILAIGLVVPPGFAMEVEQARTFEDCDAILRSRASAVECHQFLAMRTRTWSEGIRHLEARLAFDPDDQLSRAALGILRETIGDPKGDDDLKRAAEGLAAQGRRNLEGFARIGLFYSFGEQRRMAEAAQEIEAAQRALDASGDPRLAAYLEYHRGLDSYYHLDYAGAEVHFRNAGTMADALGDSHLRGWVFNSFGLCKYFTGRAAEAVADYRRSAELLSERGDRFTATSSLHGAYESAVEAGWPAAEQERLYQETFALAEASGHFKIQAELLFSRAQQDGDVEERLAMLRQSLEVLKRVRDPIQSAWVMRYTATLLASTGPARRGEAEKMLDAAIDLAHRSGDREGVARGLSRRAAIFLDAGDRDQGLATWDATLDAVEAVRDFQRDEAARAGFQSRWASYYYQAASVRLRAPGAGASAEEIEKALAIVERMRARVLLDSLDAAGVATGGGPPELRQRRAAVLDGISRVQRRLFSRVLSEGERSAGLRELDALENQERALRAETARADPSFASLRTPSPARLASIQAALDADQALLSFQSDPDASRAGWVVAITRDAVRTTDIPNRAALDGEVSLFLGMLERRDGSDAAGAARLYKDLLADLLTPLPPGITRLVVVPDGPLHRLPFDALREDASGAPLATRFEITLAPSCSAWLRWNGTPRGPGVHPVLAMADPRLQSEEGTSTSRAATLATGLRIGTLPSARAEAGEMVRRLAGGSRMVAGADASERFLKTTDLSSYRMLHLAAHAVVDEEHPERSAVLLAPGSGDEDGLLQAREIVNLDLHGRVVILSACSSASGTVLEGEGVMGLARAFFQAGAVGVVGGLWPLRDQEAARLVDDMAAGLGRGASIGTALAGARRAAIREGSPASAWAGLVVLG